MKSETSGMGYDSLFSVAGRVAVITGGAGLLAEVYARALLAFGAFVVLADVDEERCERRVEALAVERPGAAMALPCDVRTKESWEKLLEAILRIFGRVDILVNNAAYTNRTRTEGYGRSFEELPLGDWQDLIEVNLTGVFLGCQVFGEEMRKQTAGSVINIASLYGVVSPHHPIYAGTEITQPITYSVSKAGVLAITRYLATLWAPDRVRVNAITPGGIYDGQTEVFESRFRSLNPMRRMGDRSELAGALLYLASDASSYCTGHNLIVDGGWTAW